MPSNRWLPVVLLLAGCTAWGGTLTVEGIPPSPPPGKAFQVWHGDSVRELRGVRVDSDSVHGVPLPAPADCDSCRISIARAAVDSVRVREFDSGKTGLTVLVVAWVLIRTDALFSFFDDILFK